MIDLDRAHPVGVLGLDLSAEEMRAVPVLHMGIHDQEVLHVVEAYLVHHVIKNWRGMFDLME